jgi:hypothetical protein
MQEREKECRDETDKTQRYEVTKTRGDCWCDVICKSVSYESVKWIHDIPGSRLNFRQRIIRAHMKEPSRRPDKHAAVMVDEATITNLVGLICI